MCAHRRLQCSNFDQGEELIIIRIILVAGSPNCNVMEWHIIPIQSVHYQLVFSLHYEQIIMYIDLIT
jgi:hypothetical protein